MVQCSIDLKFTYQRDNMMTTTILILIFLAAIGMRIWAAKAYADYFDALPNDEQKARIRRAMMSGQ